MTGPWAVVGSVAMCLAVGLVASMQIELKGRQLALSTVGFAAVLLACAALLWGYEWFYYHEW